VTRPSVPLAPATETPDQRARNLGRLGVDMTRWDYVVALAGNPNTGKSTVFNRLTGLRQHTGNWPGKTVTRAEGGFTYGRDRFKLVDLPGTYSLLSASHDEEIARDFLLFARPEVTVVVVDPTCLERNLNLVLQILEITDRVVVCVNLMDEAERHGLGIDTERLSADLGVPVMPASARRGTGIDALVGAIHDVATGRTEVRPHRIAPPPALDHAVHQLVREIRAARPELASPRWVAMRLLDADESIVQALGSGPAAVHILELARELRAAVGDFHDGIAAAIYAEASAIAERAVTRRDGDRVPDFDRRVDRIVTSPRWGLPIMVALLAAVMWITVSGANYPSAMLDRLLLQTAHPWLQGLAAGAGWPWWLSGALIDGAYLALAWVVSVMLPPMAIFFPLFTLLEDLGYLPRVAFNLDRMFQRAGAHGKQALTMCMGFGCNAAGVIATRIIDSPRERLIAIVTNNFALCNGRWPTQILLATIFVGAVAPPQFRGVVAAGAVLAVALLGVALTFLVSRALSRTILQGEISTFSLELPPYRPPRILQTLYTSLIDRTIFVLWRAMVFAAPAGLVIWIIANVRLDGATLAGWLTSSLDPLGLLLGLNGVILLAYVVAIPANEIVIPTVLMLTVMSTGLGGVGEGAGVMFDPASETVTSSILRAGGWTLLTAVNLMLFSLMHNPCSTALYTIWKETRSAKWTWIAALLPVAMGLTVCFFVAQVWRLVAG
jgi:ferrous iron transport protein B